MAGVEEEVNRLASIRERLNLLLFVVFLMTVLSLGCTDDPSPEERLCEARILLESDAPEKAFRVFQGILNQEDEASTELRFHAARDSVLCRVRMGRFQEALEDFRNLYRSYPDEMSKPDAYTHVLTFLEDLLRQEAGIQTIVDFIVEARKQHPDAPDVFERFKDALIKRVEADDELKHLKRISYL